VAGKRHGHFELQFLIGRPGELQGFEKLVKVMILAPLQATFG
jgi:hypothetical protein